MPFAAERRAEIEHHLTVRARRSHLVQSAVTRFYVALGFFVATTIAIGLVAIFPSIDWLPPVLGIVGSMGLFSGCIQLIRETRLALTRRRPGDDLRARARAAAEPAGPA